MRETDFKNWRTANRLLFQRIKNGMLATRVELPIEKKGLLMLPGVFEFQVLIAQASEVASGARYFLQEVSSRLIDKGCLPVGLPLEQALLDYAITIDEYSESWTWYLGKWLGQPAPELIALERCRKRMALYQSLSGIPLADCAAAST